MSERDRIAIIGGGNIGQAIARGVVASGLYAPAQITITRRKLHLLEDLRNRGFVVIGDNCEAVRGASTVILAVRPQELSGVIEEIRDDLLSDSHVLLSVVTGVSIGQIVSLVKETVPVVRVMPNTAIAIGESMTCIAARQEDAEALDLARSIFDGVGQTLVIDEDQMVPATALCACGVAFFLRSIRAASQGGIEIGFHSEEALRMAAQTARGAASLLLEARGHPEAEIDKVTTPRGCTIAGLNQMEHEGFSSALIRGIVTSSAKAAKLFEENGG